MLLPLPLLLLLTTLSSHWHCFTRSLACLPLCLLLFCFSLFRSLHDAGVHRRACGRNVVDAAASTEPLSPPPPSRSYHDAALAQLTNAAQSSAAPSELSGPPGELSVSFDPPAEQQQTASQRDKVEEKERDQVEYEARQQLKAASLPRLAASTASASAAPTPTPTPTTTTTATTTATTLTPTQLASLQQLSPGLAAALLADSEVMPKLIEWALSLVPAAAAITKALVGDDDEGWRSEHIPPVGNPQALVTVAQFELQAIDSDTAWLTCVGRSSVYVSVDVVVKRVKGKEDDEKEETKKAAKEEDEEEEEEEDEDEMAGWREVSAGQQTVLQVGQHLLIQLADGSVMRFTLHHSTHPIRDLSKLIGWGRVSVNYGKNLDNQVYEIKQWMRRKRIPLPSVPWFFREKVGTMANGSERMEKMWELRGQIERGRFDNYTLIARSLCRLGQYSMPF